MARWRSEEAALRMAGGVSPCQGAWGAWRAGEWPASVPSGLFGGALGVQMDVNGVHRTPAADGCAAAEDRGGEMEIGTYLQFLKSQGPLSKLKFSLFFRAQMIKC